MLTVRLYMLASKPSTQTSGVRCTWYQAPANEAVETETAQPCCGAQAASHRQSRNESAHTKSISCHTAQHLAECTKNTADIQCRAPPWCSVSSEDQITTSPQRVRTAHSSCMRVELYTVGGHLHCQPALLSPTQITHPRHDHLCLAQGVTYPL